MLSLIATLSRTPAGARGTIEALVANNLRMPVDKTDLAEVLGNLLENAVRHAAGRVRIIADCDQSGPSVAIEDDGTGSDGTSCSACSSAASASTNEETKVQVLGSPSSRTCWTPTDGSSTCQRPRSAH